MPDHERSLLAKILLSALPPLGHTNEDQSSLPDSIRWPSRWWRHSDRSLVYYEEEVREGGVAMAEPEFESMIQPINSSIMVPKSIVFPGVFEKYWFLWRGTIRIWTFWWLAGAESPTHFHCCFRGVPTLDDMARMTMQPLFMEANGWGSFSKKRFKQNWSTLPLPCCFNVIRKTHLRNLATFFWCGRWQHVWLHGGCFSVILSFMVRVAKQHENGLNPYIFPLAISIARGVKFALAPLYLD